MMAITTINARPETLTGGTIGANGRKVTVLCLLPGSLLLAAGSVIDIQPPLGQDHPARIDPVHQTEIMGCNDHGSA